MEIFMLAIIIGLLPAWIAHNKGRNFFMWWIFGAALWIVAMPAALIISKDEEAVVERESNLKKCPYCAEWVKKEAALCKHCNSEFEPEPEPEPLKCPICHSLQVSEKDGYCDVCKKKTIDGEWGKWGKTVR